MLNWKFQEDPSDVQLKDFLRNIINLNQYLEKNTGQETAVKAIQLTEMGLNKKDQREVNKILAEDSTISDEGIKQLLHYKDPLNLSDIESLLQCITSTTLRTLFLNLFDMSLVTNHKYIIQVLHSIVYTVGKRISPHLDIMVPCLIHYINDSRTLLTGEIMTLFEKILKACGSKYGSGSPKHVHLLVDTLLKNLSEGRCMEKCLDTLTSLINSSRLDTLTVRQVLAQVQGADHLFDTLEAAVPVECA